MKDDRLGERIGDKPIESEFVQTMRQLGRLIETSLVVDGRRAGFILMAFPFDGHEGRANYISNASRADVIVLLKEQLARFEGQAVASGRA